MYISVAPNGRAMISTRPPVDEFYIKADALPEGDGPLMLSADGTLYRLPAREPEPEPVEPKPTQLDIIEAQVAYTAMMTGTILEV